MYNIDQDTCIACGSCVGTCPSEAIVEDGASFKITEECIDCGSCVDSCPVDAIAPA